MKMIYYGFVEKSPNRLSAFSPFKWFRMAIWGMPRFQTHLYYGWVCPKIVDYSILITPQYMSILIGHPIFSILSIKIRGTHGQRTPICFNSRNSWRSGPECTSPRTQCSVGLMAWLWVVDRRGWCPLHYLLRCIWMRQRSLGSEFNSRFANY
jgi:hypothetical protein